MSEKRDRLVYSTDAQVMQRCPRCGKYPCICRRAVVSLPPDKQTARISQERKGRKGKTVTLVSGLQLAEDDLEALAKTLKTLCGAGGTVKEGQIEVQGEHRDRVAAALAQLGYKVKRIGG